MKRDVIIACDFAGREETLRFLDQFENEKPFVKIGMELFYGEGPQIVREIKARGHEVFLDLKLHDIPNTVKKAMRNLAALGADMVNLHAAGGSAMMRAALEGLEAGAKGARPRLIAVTQLTSCLLYTSPSPRAQNSGLDGVVCSPLEAKAVKEACSQAFLTVTPGVRFADDDVGDQKRVTTPARARALGSDYIVVGRSITAAADPVAAYRRAVKDFVEGEEA